MRRTIAIATICLALAGTAAAEVWEYAISAHLNAYNVGKTMWVTGDANVDVPSDAKVPTVLNAMGKERWELVQVLRSEGKGETTTTFYWKRQIAAGK